MHACLSQYNIGIASNSLVPSARCHRLCLPYSDMSTCTCLL